MASQGSFGVGKRLLSIKNNSVVSLPDSGLPSVGLGGIWFETNKKYYAVGGGIYTKVSITDTKPWDTLEGVSIYGLGAIRGTGINNIIATGSFGECVHFNGVTWKNYPEVMINGYYGNLDMKNKIVVLCGIHTNKAIIAIGKQK